MDAAQIGTLIVALTGVVTAAAALIKNRTDAKLGIRTADREDETTFDERYRNIIDDVQEHLLKPLRSDLDQERKQRILLEAKVDSMSKLYRDSLGYIRILIRWVNMNVNDQQVADLPSVPESIKNDI